MKRSGEAGPQPGMVLRNPLRRGAPAVSPASSVRWFHERLPDYTPTPLHIVPSLAELLGVARVLVKDEAIRLGLPAFKMLGASWAVYLALCDRLGREVRDWRSVDDLRDIFAPLKPLTLAAATDGNHGRAVARMARHLGLGSKIWVPLGTAEARIRAIAEEGARVSVSAGGYDDAVAEAAASANERTLVIADTALNPNEPAPQRVIDGYGTIFEEVDEQLIEKGLAEPDAVFVPIGVGAFAAAAARHFRSVPGSSSLLVGAEPLDAACVLQSARAGRMVTLLGPQRSIMAGLNCGTPSSVAWPLVSQCFDLFVAVNDAEVIDAMRKLATAGIASGESGAASLAAATVLMQSGVEPRLGRSSTLLLISTEGITDPEFYAREIVARD